MIKKFLIYCKSDGISSALRFTFKTMSSYFYTRSKTVFFELDKPSLKIQQNSDFIVKNMTLADLDSINFPRLKLLDYKKWIQNGSKLYIGFVNGTPISFTWTHYNNYKIHGLGHFILKENECWIGPTFVHKNFRGRGYNKEQIASQIANNNSIKFYTSINSNNMPSIKSFVHWGFVKVGETDRITTPLNSKIKVSGNNDFSTKLKLL